MGNWLEGLLIGIPLLVFVIKLIATQYITELVKRLFNGRSDMKAFATFYFALSLSFIIGLLMVISPYISEMETTPEGSETEKDTLFIEQNRPKTDKEVELEMINKGIQLGSDIIEGAQTRNEELRERKGYRFVYQIGDVIDNEKELFKKFRQLKNLSTINSSLLKAFKIKRKKFLIIYDLHKSKDEMNNSLPDFKASLSSVENNITVRELNQECKARQEIVTTKPLDRRKFDFKIECLECD